MNLRSQFYLSDAAATARPAGKRPSRFKPVWAIPRAWCATAVLPAKGVPRHKTAAFVRLNLGRLSPFVDCGVYACRSGDLVHIWFWENRRVREFCQKHGMDFDSIALAPESLCLPKGREGVVVHQCIEGVEAQLWHNGLLIDSAWWPRPFDAEEWEAWRQQKESSVSGRSPETSWPEKVPVIQGPAAIHGAAVLPRLSAPWAGNLLSDRWPRKVRLIRLDVFAVGVAGLMLACAGFWCAEWLVLQYQQDSVAGKNAALSERVEPLNALRSKALDDLQWTTQLARLRASDSIDEALDNLQPILQQQEAALREFEYVEGEMRLTLVPINTELNIPAVIQQLEAQPTLTAVRLLPDSDMRLLRVSAKIRPLAGAAAIARTGTTSSGAGTVAPARQLAPNEGKRERGE